LKSGLLNPISGTEGHICEMKDIHTNFARTSKDPMFMETRILGLMGLLPEKRFGGS